MQYEKTPDVIFKLFFMAIKVGCLNVAPAATYHLFATSSLRSNIARFRFNFTLLKLAIRIDADLSSSRV
jgi:hypothetical protein